MPGLILKLKPHEELMINGVVVQNGERKTRLCVKTEGAAILRLRDAMRAEEATTPERKAYYLAQLAVSGELAACEAEAVLAAALAKLAERHPDGLERQAVNDAAEELAAKRFYGVMRRLGALIHPQCASPPARLVRIERRAARRIAPRLVDKTSRA